MPFRPDAEPLYERLAFRPALRGEGLALEQGEAVSEPEFLSLHSRVRIDQPYELKGRRAADDQREARPPAVDPTEACFLAKIFEKLSIILGNAYHQTPIARADAPFAVEESCEPSSSPFVHGDGL